MDRRTDGLALSYIVSRSSSWEASSKATNLGPLPVCIVTEFLPDATIPIALLLARRRCSVDSSRWRLSRCHDVRSWHLCRRHRWPSIQKNVIVHILNNDNLIRRGELATWTDKRKREIIHLNVVGLGVISAPGRVRHSGRRPLARIALFAIGQLPRWLTRLLKTTNVDFESNSLLKWLKTSLPCGSSTSSRLHQQPSSTCTPYEVVVEESWVSAAVVWEAVLATVPPSATTLFKPTCFWALEFHYTSFVFRSNTDFSIDISFIRLWSRNLEIIAA